MAAMALGATGVDVAAMVLGAAGDTASAFVVMTVWTLGVAGMVW